MKLCIRNAKLYTYYLDILDSTVHLQWLLAAVSNEWSALSVFKKLAELGNS